MSAGTATAALEPFADFVQHEVALAPFTYLKIGGPAEHLAQPRTRQELADLTRVCFRQAIPFRVLGSGCNVLIRDEGVRGVVVRLAEPEFTRISVDGRRIRSAAGATLSALISESSRNGLAGLETLVGIPATVGGALRCNAGDRSDEIGRLVRSVEVLDDQGHAHERDRDELRFGHRESNLDDPVLLSVELEMETDQVDAIVKRMRKAWIQRKASQPLSFQPAIRIFKNPRGMNASALIAQFGLAGTRVGGAEISDRDANFIVAQPGATARDVLRLIDLMRSRVHESSGIDLEQEIAIW